MALCRPNDFGSTEESLFGPAKFNEMLGENGSAIGRIGPVASIGRHR
jgi:hypothetical protein